MSQNEKAPQEIGPVGRKIGKAVDADKLAQAIERLTGDDPIIGADLELVAEHAPNTVVVPADPADGETGFDSTAFMVLIGHRARDLRKIRKGALGMNQDDFAAHLGVSVGAYRDWEQSRTLTPKPMLALARLAVDQPAAFAQAMGRAAA